MELEYPNQELVKCVVVGDTGVGKTRLVCAKTCGNKYTLGQLMQTHHPSVWAIDNYRRDGEVLRLSCCVVDGVNVSLRLWDTFGYHDKDRRFAYSRADVVLLCFSTVRPLTLKNVEHVWFPEIKRTCPNTPIVLVGCQIDLRYLYKDPDFIAVDKGPFFQMIKESDIILPDVGRRVGNAIGAHYFESSVLTLYGVEEVFENVIRTALIERGRMRFWNPQLKHVQPPVIQAPHLPPPNKTHPLRTLESMYATDMARLLDDHESCNIIFFINGTKIYAHKIILISASSIFYNLFMTNLRNADLVQVPKDAFAPEEKIHAFDCDNELLLCGNSETTMSNLNGNFPDSANVSGLHLPPAFSSVKILPVDDPSLRTSPSRAEISVTGVTLNPNISPEVFRVILLFIYTGKAVLDAPHFNGVKYAAELLGLPELVAMVTNAENGMEKENVQEECNFLRRRAERMRELLIKQGLFSDILFRCEEGEVLAHKSVLMNRCDWMMALFTDNFRESSLRVIPLPGMTKQTFQCLQDYLYTDQCPDLTGVDVIELMEVANRFCLPRLLSLLEEAIVSKMTDADEYGEDVVEEVMCLLEPAQYCNAMQLAAWCRCFLSNHYHKVFKHHYKVLRSLHPDNQDYLTNNRWPPLWYVKEQDLYEKLSSERIRQQLITSPKRQRNNSGCLCLRARRWKKINREQFQVVED